MTRPLSLVARLVPAMIAVGSIMFGPGGPAAADGGPAQPAQVRFVVAAPGLEAADRLMFDGDAVGSARFGSATNFVAAPAGQHVLVVRGQRTTISLGAGCLHTFVLVRRLGLAGPVDAVDAAECDRRRTAPGAASVRFIQATADSPAALLRVADRQTGVAEPFVATGRVEVPSGDQLLEVRAAGSDERLGFLPYTLLANSAVTAVWAGGGDAADLRLLVVLDGVQPAFAPTMPINTGVSPGPQRRPAAAVAGAAVALAALGAVFAGCGRGPGRAKARRMAAAAVVTVALTGCRAVQGDGKAGTSRPSAARIDLEAGSVVGTRRRRRGGAGRARPGSICRQWRPPRRWPAGASRTCRGWLRAWTAEPSRGSPRPPCPGSWASRSSLPTDHSGEAGGPSTVFAS